MDALKVFSLLTVLTGIVYPLLVTGVSQVVYNDKANGSLIIKDGTAVGSEYIGQNFKSEKYFWPRPSAIEYNPLPSGATNLAPTSAALKQAYDERKLKGFTYEMLFASASGLDPHISPGAALSQVSRIVESRAGLSEEVIVKLIGQMTEKRDFKILGEERVNVLKLNLQLDDLNQNYE